MRKFLSILVTFVMMIVLVVTPSFAASVTPELVENWQSGDAYSECEEAGCDAAFAFKVDFGGGPNGSHNCDGGNVITVSSTPIRDEEKEEVEYKSFDWTSDYPVAAVIVKAGTNAFVYWYDGEYSDTNLNAPDGKGISHVTFCYNKPCTCYKEETAWAVGNKYNTGKGGNWAMYVTYYGTNKTVDLRAAGGNGVGMYAGTATLEPNDGQVKITIDLANGFIFYYDAIDAVYDNNIKIQRYVSAPKGNPAPGQFTNKAHADAGATSYTITVPVSSFYGIHLDVAYPVPYEDSCVK